MKPFGLVAIALIVGICAGPYACIPFIYAYISCASLLLLALININRRYFTFFLLASVVFCGCVFYGNSILLPKDHIARFSDGGKCAVTGLVAGDVERGFTRRGARKTAFVISARSLSAKGGYLPVTGLVSVYIYGRTKEISYGDELLLEGRLMRPKEKANGGFDYKAHLERNNIYSILNVDYSGSVKVIRRNARVNPFKKMAFMARERAFNIITTALPVEQSSLLSAMLLGKRDRFFYEKRASFAKTGTAHVLAISGLHVGLIAFVLYTVFNALRLNRRFSISLVILSMILYALITGARIPVVRATIMISVLFAGYLLGRNPAPFNSLGLAAIIILLFNPKQLFSPSFQLSFCAVLAILYLTPGIERVLRLDLLLRRRGIIGRVARYPVKLFSVSTAAWLGVLPIVAYYFNTLTPVSILGNLVVIPLTFLIIASSLSFIAFSFLPGPPGLSQVFVTATGGLIRLLEFSVEKLASIPFACIEIGSPRPFFIFFYYAAVFIIFKYLKRCYNKKL